MSSGPSPRESRTRSRTGSSTGGARGSRTPTSPASPASYAEIYRRVRAEGTVSRNFPISMRILQADDIGQSRIGFVIRKRTGNAPLRNAMRRVLRDIFRLRAPSFARPAWLIFDVSDRAAKPDPKTRASDRAITRAEFRAKAEALLAPLRTPPITTEGAA